MVEKQVCSFQYVPTVEAFCHGIIKRTPNSLIWVPVAKRQMFFVIKPKDIDQYIHLHY